jgi:hypothetical protein
VKLRKRLKKVYGVGVNDLDYPVHEFEYVRDEKGNLKISKRIWTCPFYEVWRDMIKRCYNEKDQIKQPTYVGAWVCDEWLILSKFKAWMESKDWVGKQLDKDLLVVGNKVYSPETCLFISIELNQFFKDRSNDRGPYPLGVSMHMSGEYYARCSDPFLGKRVSLGLHSTPEAAHEAWRKYKHSLALRYCEILRNEGYLQEVIDALSVRYEARKEIENTAVQTQ